MVNEAILREHDGELSIIEYTVADGTAITKGALLALTDPRTAVLATTAAQPVAGIAAREKVASDGRTRMACYVDGIFDMVASGAISVGSPVTTASTGSLNYVSGAVISGANVAAVSGAAIMGYALETASDNEVFQVRLVIGG